MALTAIRNVSAPQDLPDRASPLEPFHLEHIVAGWHPDGSILEILAWAAHFTLRGVA